MEYKQNKMAQIKALLRFPAAIMRVLETKIDLVGRLRCSI